MKIIVDKLEAWPPHALSIEDVKAIMRVIPAEWSRYIHVVHLKATLPEHSRFARPVILSIFRLNICSRGLTKEAAQRDVLRELAVHGVSMTRRMVHRLSKADSRIIGALID